MKLNSNITVNIENQNCYVYFTDKNQVPYFASDKITATTLTTKCLNSSFEYYYKTVVCWKAELDVSKLTNLTDILDLASGEIKIYRLWTEGTSCPDIATYWIAVKDGIPISLGMRGSLWKSDSEDYPNWLNKLRAKYSLVTA